MINVPKNREKLKKARIYLTTTSESDIIKLQLINKYVIIQLEGNKYLFCSMEVE